MTRTQALRMAKANKARKMRAAATAKFALVESVRAIGERMDHMPPLTAEEMDILVFGSVEAADEWDAQWNR